MIELTKNNFEAETKGFLVVDFWATWCGPCIKLTPIFEELSNEYDKARFAKVQVDKSPEAQELASKFRVTGIPCIIVMKDGKEVDRLVGFRNKDQLKEELDKIIN
jgi:thioredoxin 1